MSQNGRQYRSHPVYVHCFTFESLKLVVLGSVTCEKGVGIDRAKTLVLALCCGAWPLFCNLMSVAALISSAYDLHAARFPFPSIVTAFCPVLALLFFFNGAAHS